jgi:hypothetical protein
VGVGAKAYALRLELVASLTAVPDPKRSWRKAEAPEAILSLSTAAVSIDAGTLSAAPHYGLRLTALSCQLHLRNPAGGKAASVATLCYS